MAKGRKTVMGFPVGKAKPGFPLARVAKVGAVGATLAAAIPAAQKAVPAAQKGAKVVSKGQELVGQAGHAASAASEVKDAVSSHSSTAGKAVGLVGALGHIGKKDDGKPKLAHLIEEHTDISVPRSVAYNQWTQMEMMSKIAKGVAAVDQKKDDEAQWTSKIGPIKRQWKAKITEQIPDERIAWKSDGGPEQQGVVTFHSLDEDLTRVLIQMHYKPHGPFEVVGNKLRIQRRRVRRDLRLFKHFLELRGEATGAWRGTIGDQSKHRADSDGARRPGRPGSGRSANREGSSGRPTRPATAKRTTAAKSTGAGRNGSTHRSASGSSPSATGAARSATTRRTASSPSRSSSANGSSSRSASSNGRSTRSRSSNGSSTRTRAASR